jgi:hypothetical protein
MEQAIRKSVDKEGKESVSYSKSWEKNGIRNSIEVRKVDGGYIIRKSRYGKPADDPEAQYIEENSESVSTTNPFEKKEEKKNDDKMFSFIDLPELM